jgi:hypothetical protein
MARQSSGLSQGRRVALTAAAKGRYSTVKAVRIPSS